MRDTDLYRQILGLDAPWFVEKVDLRVSDGEVDVWVSHKPGLKWRCPECGRELACRDHAEERTWRHLDTCQFKTILHARIPRVDCPEHGVSQVKVPWSEPRSRFTLLFERLVIDVVRETATVRGACRVLGLSWDEVWGVMSRATRRGLARRKEKVIRVVGVDEKAFRKGHEYMTIVCDGDESTVEYVARDRKAESLAGFYSGLSEAQKSGIEAVVMDMWDPYVKATSEGLPDGRSRIVFDRFHVMKQVNEAVDAVRKHENRSLREDGDDRLKGTKYVWLYAAENLPDKYRAVLRGLKASTLKVARAWAIKEALRKLWDYSTRGWAIRYFRWWFAWARRSQLPPIMKVAKMVEDHIENILTYCSVKVTNAVAEGLNSKIMAIKRRACGYRNEENFKTAIYFFCGGLDLHPR